MVKKRSKKSDRVWPFWVAVVLVAILILAVTAAHDRHLQISRIQISGNKTIADSALSEVINQKLAGYYFFIFPRRNALVYPKGEIMAAISAGFPSLSKVELVENDWRELDLRVVERRGQYFWCAASSSPEACFFADETGYVFAPAPQFSAPLFLKFFASSTADSLIGTSPLPTADFVRIAKLKDEVTTVLAESDLANFLVTEAHPGELRDWRLRIVPAESSSRVGINLLFSLDEEANAVVNGLHSVLNNPDFQRELEAHNFKLDYLDLRFVPKVFYSYNEAS